MELLRSVVQILVAASLALTVAEVYLTVNKIWKRKHERAVAQSISIMGEFMGLVPLFFLGLSFILDGQWEAAANALLWIFGALVMIAIGSGLWVEGQRGREFLSLIRDAIRLERGEVTALARTLFRPAAASKILDILARLAVIDKPLDAREDAFIKTFADSWGLSLPYAILRAEGGGHATFIALRNDAAEYLATSPPPAQVRQLGDVARALVSVDERITEEESIILAELEGMWSAYLDDADATPNYMVALVPQSAAQDTAIASVLRSARKTPIHGGEVYVAGRYHSERYAEIVGQDYRALNIFTTVIRLPPATQAMPAA